MIDPAIADGLPAPATCRSNLTPAPESLPMSLNVERHGAIAVITLNNSPS